MNILIYSVRLDTGGISSVSVFLANAWKNAGHRVAIVCFEDITEDVKNKLEPEISIYCFGLYKYNQENISKLRSVLVEESIDVVVNQFGLPWIPMKTLQKAGKGLSFKTVSCYHSAPNANARLTAINKKLELYPSGLKRFCLKSEYLVLSYITSRSMRYVYNHSDAYVLLSAKFFQKFLKFTGVGKSEKLYSIPNPVTLENIPTNVNNRKKEKILLYVGRVDVDVKRVDRVIEIWEKIEQKFCDWSLVIVGDGKGLPVIKEMAKSYDLKRVSFEGFKNPEPYYEKASIILLTSDFEGFGLVLVEGMSYGVVPVAYGSYDSVFDIIKDGYNGFVVMPEDGGFPLDGMVERIASIMKDKDKLDDMSLKSLQISKKFSHAEILSKWDDLFMKLNVLR